MTGGRPRRPAQVLEWIRLPEVTDEGGRTVARSVVVVLGGIFVRVSTWRKDRLESVAQDYFPGASVDLGTGKITKGRINMVKAGWVWLSEAEETGSSCSTSIMQMPGGVVVRTSVFNDDIPVGVSLVFVPAVHYDRAAKSFVEQKK